MSHRKTDLGIPRPSKSAKVVLALLHPKSLPTRSIKPIKVLPNDNLEVGADVQAIGHPTGEAWTYTTGIISQIRSDYEWSDAGPRTRPTQGATSYPR